MGRRNRRDSDHDPVPSDFSPPAPSRINETRDEREARLWAEAKRRRERNNRRADERIAAAVDWDQCCIPGCGAAVLLHQSNGATQGQIYFVRLNGLIKVGWSGRLRDRLKSYGASAEVLAHYPAPRQEETDMHRTLRPYLARGREWYHECKLLEDMIAGVIAKHGGPTIEALWTEPKRDAARPKGWPAA